MDNVHSFYGDAQSGSHHLGKGGFVPLTMAVRAGENGDAAGGVHANFTALKQARPGTQCACNIGRGDATRLDITGVSDATQFAFGLAAGLTLGITRHISQFLCLVHAGVIVTDIVLQCNRGLVWKLGDEITLANFILRQTHFPGGTADQAFEQIGGFWPTCATVSINGCGVGEPCIHLYVNLRGCVLPSQQGGVQNGGNGG